MTCSTAVKMGGLRLRFNRNAIITLLKYVNSLQKEKEGL